MRPYLEKAHFSPVFLIVLLFPLPVKLEEERDYCKPDEAPTKQQYFRAQHKGISRLKTGIISQSNVLSLLKCSGSCLETRFCVAYNYKKMPKEKKEINCQLSHTTNHKFERVSNEENDWVFYRIHGEGTSTCKEVNKCENDGKMVFDENKLFKCEFVEDCEGDHCESCVIHKLKFIGSVSKYAKANGPQNIANVTSLTTCFWIRTEDGSEPPRAILSYADDIYTNGMLITMFYSKLRVYMFDERKGHSCAAGSDLTLNDGKWHYICYVWQSENGKYSIYKNGKMEENDSIGCSSGKVLSGRATLVLGQDQDELGGGFEPGDAFVGEIADLNVWYGVLSSETILEMSKRCRQVADNEGNMNTWAQFTSGREGLELVKVNCNVSGNIIRLD